MKSCLLLNLESRKELKQWDELRSGSLGLSSSAASACFVLCDLEKAPGFLWAGFLICKLRELG